MREEAESLADALAARKVIEQRLTEEHFTRQTGIEVNFRGGDSGELLSELVRLPRLEVGLAQRAGVHRRAQRAARRRASHHRAGPAHGGRAARPGGARAREAATIRALRGTECISITVSYSDRNSARRVGRSDPDSVDEIAVDPA